MAFLREYGSSIINHNTETATGANLGDLVFENDAIFRYVRASAAIAAGNVVISKTAYTSVDNITGFSNTGDRATGRYPYVEDSAWGLTAGVYDGGFLYIDADTGVGQLKRVVKNTSTRVYFKALYPRLGAGEDDPFATAPDITSDVTVICPWHVAKCGASDKIQNVVGYAPQAITSGYYGWVVAYGVGNPSMGGTGVIDTLVVPGDDTAGQGTIAATTDDLGDGTPFGVALFAGADDTKWPVLMRCAL